jgi:DNA-binding transcriptional ArsR family regulator
MVVGYAERADADRLFHALADATRRDIVTRTMGQEYSVSDLARAYPMSFAAVQKHVAVLERAELVTKRRQGREQLVRGNIDAVRRTHRLLDEFEAQWLDRLDRFATVLADDLERRPDPTEDNDSPTEDNDSPTEDDPTEDNDRRSAR